MKKTAAVLCVIAVIISLSSCKLNSNKDVPDYKTSNSLVSSVEEHYTEDFADSKGNVICSIDMTYPVFECEDSPAVANNMNYCFDEYKKAAVNSIKSNLGNTAEYKKKFNIEGVTVTKIVYEITECNDCYISVTLNEKTGTDISKATGNTTGYTFSMVDGSRLTLQSLLKPDMIYNEELVKNLIKKQANLTYANGAALEEDKQVTLDSLYSSVSFCCKPEGIVFYYSYEILSGGDLDGIYECVIDYADLLQYMTPEEYYDMYYTANA